MRSRPEGFTSYVALGDSMSMDVYPAQELPAGATSTAVGAASLLHRNVDDLWPEFAGHDLVRRYDGMPAHDLTADGATTDDVLGRQVPTMQRLLPGGDESVLVTLTVGGNDLIGLLLSASPGDLAGAAARVPGAVARVVAEILEALPRALVLLTTTYDPTDGTGHLPGLSESYGRLPIELLGRYNDALRDLADRTEGVLLADVHAHFLGHGVSAGDEELWYWPHSLIEPGLRGASEIRRVWLDSLESRAGAAP